MNYILNEAGEPVLEPDVIKWGTWFGNIENRIVAKDRIGDVEVSTVFLAIDHGWIPGELPVLWETMIFGDEAYADYRERYTSLADAKAGHAEAVKMLKKEAAKLVSPEPV